MELQREETTSKEIRLSYIENGREVARARLDVRHNDLHEAPYGFIEDVFVAESHRNRGLGTKIVETILAEARVQGCYKVICTSRFTKPKVHRLYEKMGFRKHGFEFRIDL